MNTVAVVVTYNRKVLLLECILALLEQTSILDKIIIIDNNSTDGTYELLKEKNIIKDEKILYKKLDKNIGGAGGFYEGLKHANTFNPNWVWIMDDDTIPKNSALEELLKSAEFLKSEQENISFLASSVYGMNGEFMNVPKINDSETNSGYPGWYKYLNRGLIKISEATFVSLLINGDAIKKVGLPVKDYFIWGDDIEYTLRLNKYFGNAYMVGRSEVIHKRKGGKSLSILEENDKKRLKLYYYMVRNNYINIKEYKKYKKLIIYALRYRKMILKILFSRTSKYKFYKCYLIYKGLYHAKFRKYNYKEFKNRLNFVEQRES